MNWTMPDPKPHVPQVLSKEGLEEIRLLGLYPCAADLLATLDAALDESERLRKECAEERAAYLNASHERDALRAYAELVTGLLREAQAHIRSSLPGFPVTTAAQDEALLRRIAAALAKNPNPSATPDPHGSATGHVGTATEAEGVVGADCHETCTEDELGSCMHGVPSDIECAICDVPDKPTPMMVEAAKLHKKLRHQSCTKSPVDLAQRIRNTAAALQGFEDRPMYGDSSRLAIEFNALACEVEQALFPQVGRDEADLIRRASDLFERWNSTDIDPDDEEYEPWIADFTASVASWLDDADCLVAGKKP